MEADHPGNGVLIARLFTPIVHSVEDALAVLATTGLDAVLCEDILVEKPE